MAFKYNDLQQSTFNLQQLKLEIPARHITPAVSALNAWLRAER
jgi:hypothetical protein